MLTIHFGDMDGVVYNTSVYFNNTYSGEWFSDPFAQKMIASADKGTVLGPNAIEAKTMGVVPPEKLSSGLKMLLLMYFFPERAYNASNRGDNCARWILAIAKKQDIKISLSHLVDFGGRRFTETIANTGEVTQSMDELVLVGAKCFREASLRGASIRLLRATTRSRSNSIFGAI